MAEYSGIPSQHTSKHISLAGHLRIQEATFTRISRYLTGPVPIQALYVMVEHIIEVARSVVHILEN